MGNKSEEKASELAEDTMMKEAGSSSSSSDKKKKSGKGTVSLPKFDEGKTAERRVSNSTSSIYINSTLSVPDNDEISELNWTGLFGQVVVFVALRCVALRCVALRCVALRCVALRCLVLSRPASPRLVLSCLVVWCLVSACPFVSSPLLPLLCAPPPLPPSQLTYRHPPQCSESVPCCSSSWLRARGRARLQTLNLSMTSLSLTRT